MYVRDLESSVIRPEKELKAFAKVALEPGEEKTVTFSLSKRAFDYYNVEFNDWHAESGDFEILVGSSSQDMLLKETINLSSSVTVSKKFHRNSTIGELMNNPVGAQVADKLIRQVIGEVDSAMMREMMKSMPLRALLNFSQGKINEDMLAEILQFLKLTFRAF